MPDEYSASSFLPKADSVIEKIAYRYLLITQLFAWLTVPQPLGDYPSIINHIIGKYFQVSDGTVLYRTMGEKC